MIEFGELLMASQTWNGTEAWEQRVQGVPEHLLNFWGEGAEKGGAMKTCLDLGLWSLSASTEWYKDGEKQE